MSLLKPKGIEINIDGIKRHLLFNINVINELQEKFDMYIADIINSMFLTDDVSRKNSYNTLATILEMLLREDTRIHNNKNKDDQRDEITEEFLKEEALDNDTSKKLAVLVLHSFNGTLPKTEDEESPN